MHTSPLSSCAKAEVRESLEYYKSLGYAGVFITDHFIDGNIDRNVRTLPYEEKIEYFFRLQESAVLLGENLGIKVFPGFEMSYAGTDFLVYGIDKDWCMRHKDMDKMRKTELLTLLANDGALIIHAHPFREAGYIDHIRLFPRHVHGVEVYNASMSDFVNQRAEEYSKNYALIRFAGSDNHRGPATKSLAGMATEAPLKDVNDFISAVLSGNAKPFKKDENGIYFI